MRKLYVYSYQGSFIDLNHPCFLEFVRQANAQCNVRAYTSIPSSVFPVFSCMSSLIGRSIPAYTPASCCIPWVHPQYRQTRMPIQTAPPKKIKETCSPETIFMYSWWYEKYLVNACFPDEIFPKIALNSSEQKHVGAYIPTCLLLQARFVKGFIPLPFHQVTCADEVVFLFIFHTGVGCMGYYSTRLDYTTMVLVAYFYE